MFENWKSLIPTEFADQSKVWVYQSNRLFTLSEALQIESMLEDFVTNWQSHGAKVKGYANLLFGQFLILMADETSTTVSGCSTDSSVRLIKEIERLFQVSLFDRQTLGFIRKDKVELIPMEQFSYAMDGGLISPETLYFNNLVSTKSELLNRWIIPVKNSWLSKKFPLINADIC